MAIQLDLSLHNENMINEELPIRLTGNSLDNLINALSSDLDFTDTLDDIHLAHKLHSFPAKFPPHLPRKFILELTDPNDVVLDPMMGSGTTLLEAFFQNRQAIGLDIDPLAILISQVKLKNINKNILHSIGIELLNRAKQTSSQDLWKVEKEKRFDTKTIEFIDYWFALETQQELIALIIEIEKIEDIYYKNFFELLFSSIIITKTGGVSLALDLAHTRPHKAKAVYKNGKLLFGDKNETRKYLIKTLRSPFDEFEKKINKSLDYLHTLPSSKIYPVINLANAQALTLPANSVDLIVTSPPYASNAIDYMRAHKFSLVWFGYSIDTLTKKRKSYIGSEGNIDLPTIKLPTEVEDIINLIKTKNNSKGNALKRYYLEMTLVLQEMYRVLRNEKPAILVVGNSIMAGEDIQISQSLIHIGKMIGFDIPKVGIRQIDRNRRMLPTGTNINASSQIEQRMHEEYVIGFYKP